MIPTFEVANIRCGGCASTIRTALANAGFLSVRVDLLSEPKKVSAEIQDDEHLSLFKKILKEHGYPLVDEKLTFIDGVSLKAKSFVSCAIGKMNTDSNEE
jgi:copper chaperone CopZ